jgi:hypothetical protein
MQKSRRTAVGGRGPLQPSQRWQLPSKEMKNGTCACRSPLDGLGLAAALGVHEQRCARADGATARSGGRMCFTGGDSASLGVVSPRPPLLFATAIRRGARSDAGGDGGGWSSSDPSGCRRFHRACRTDTGFAAGLLIEMGGETACAARPARGFRGLWPSWVQGWRAMRRSNADGEGAAGGGALDKSMSYRRSGGGGRRCCMARAAPGHARRGCVDRARSRSTESA